MAAGQRSPASSDFCYEPHAGALLQGLEGLRSNSLLVDVVLCVDGKEIPCHRAVLAACSEYFHAMFCNGLRESKEHKVTIHEVSTGTLQLLVDYAYTSKVTVTEDNAVKLMKATNFFQIQPVFDACMKFLLEGLRAENCLSILDLGGMLSPELEKRASLCALNDFVAVSKTPEFLHLTKDQLITLISSDDLNAPEEVVYTSVMTWINHDTGERNNDMKELMELVRFPFMDKQYFFENVESNEFVRRACPDIMAEARRYQLFPGEVQSPRTRPRHASGLREAVVVIGGTEIRNFSDSNSIRMTCSAEPSSTSWTPLTQMKQDDFGFAAAVLGTSDIIVSAGMSSPKAVWLYNVELDNWARLAPMNVNRSFHKLAVVQGKVYAIGGIENSSKFVLDSVEVYNRRLNKWTEGVALPQPKSRHAAAVLDGNIYVIGGCDERRGSTSTHSTVYRFTPGESQWLPQSNIPEACQNISASALNGNIYVAGLRRVYSFMPGESGGSWSEVATEGVYSFHGMTAFVGRIYICGGLHKPTEENNDMKVLCLDPETKSLNHVGTMPTDLYGHVCVTVLI
ncbi:KLHL24 [Branchiostoma lanceolatum]|uniref:KLHL24 protein n=1 Tax=Branchiostoma lanceolatum TaxID=7740 RepID=A0A8K0EPI9_BRALA|nr:KLHL24 [Branchiostoma lanceolatum]